MKDDLGRFDVPPVRSLAWAGATLLLLGYIKNVPRSIDDIVAWGKERGRSGSTIRHMLAWLSFEGLVHYAVVPKVWKIGEEPRPRSVGEMVETRDGGEHYKHTREDLRESGP